MILWSRFAENVEYQKQMKLSSNVNDAVECCMSKGKVYICAMCNKAIIKGETFIVYKSSKPLCGIVCWEKQIIKDIEDGG